LKTRSQYRDWLHRQMIRMEPLDDTPKPDEPVCRKVAKVAAKMAARHGLGGEPAREAQRVRTPEAALSLLADCLRLLEEKPPQQGPFTVEEVAERWGVSVRTVGDLVRNGQLGCFRPGNGRGVIRISEDHIAEYERQQPARPSTRRHRHL
jgi:excisionase family DNA binding protein